MPFFSDLYKVWKLQNNLDPIQRREINMELSGAGVTVADAIQDIRGSGEYMGGSRGIIRLRDSSDFVDLSSITNRQSRYKEYERLRAVPEIENAITIFADEACMVGSTPVATPFGFQTIEDLAKIKQPGERFLVYCYDFEKKDYSFGWAHSPRKTKRAKTVVVATIDGKQFECTPEHKVLLADGQWIEAGKLKIDDEIMAFHRIRANNDLKIKKFARVLTHRHGWVRERDLVNEFKGKKFSQKEEKLYKITRIVASGCGHQETSNLAKWAWPTCNDRLVREGFTYRELHELWKKTSKTRKVMAIWEGKEQDVYDLSVEIHENFCTDVGVFHNCQIGENGHMFEISVKNPDVKKELEYLFFHPLTLNVDENSWGWCRDLFLFGDHFMELIIDPDEPKLGILKVQSLPPESMYRIVTIKDKTVEYQQSKEGPDYQSLARVELTKATDADLAQATAIRFAPESIIHFRIGGNRKTFYPYGVSLVEAARGPAHQLKIMEDAMLIYRLSRAPERKVFYIDVGQMPAFKAEAFMHRMQDMFQKKKTFSTKGGGGANSVEERWQAPAMNEDYWIPTRPNVNTRVETLPNMTQNDQDDVLFFRNKLLTSLCIPSNYMFQDDPMSTRVTLSSVHVKFARLVERLQRSIANGMTEIATRHLQLLGYPPSLWDDLQIKMTPPSHYRELSENEIKDARVNRLATLKGTMILSDYDLLKDVMHYSDEDAKEKVSRSMIQKLQELKLQVMSQNPQLLGIAMPEPESNEMGTTPTGPSPEQMPGEGMSQEETPPQETGEMETEPQAEETEAIQLPEPTDDEIKQYDLEILDLSKGLDEEEPDLLELDDE